jgi:hypothetical protein
MELLHQVYVISSEITSGKFSSKIKRNQKFINDNESFTEEEKIV